MLRLYYRQVLKGILEGQDVVIDFNLLHVVKLDEKKS